MPKPKIVIKKSKDKQYYMNLISTNSQVVVTSEMYKNKQSVQDAAKLIKEIITEAEVVDKTKKVKK